MPIESVEVLEIVIEAVVSVFDSIGVHHRNYSEYEQVGQCTELWVLYQILDETFSAGRARGF